MPPTRRPRATRDLRVYLGDILAAISRIEEYTLHGEQQFLASYLVQDGVIRQLSIIGEAASKLPAAVRARHPAVAWKSIIAMRAILLPADAPLLIPHVWETVERELPPLRTAVAELLASWRGGHRRVRSPDPRSRRRAENA